MSTDAPVRMVDAFKKAPSSVRGGLETLCVCLAALTTGRQRQNDEPTPHMICEGATLCN